MSRTKILALVSLLLTTHFKRCSLILGDIPNLWIIKKDYFWLIWLQLTIVSIKLWPRLEFCHWSLSCWAPFTNDQNERIFNFPIHYNGTTNKNFLLMKRERSLHTKLLEYKNLQSHNMILMSKYKGQQHGGKKGQQIRARPSPPFRATPERNWFFLWEVFP